MKRSLLLSGVLGATVLMGTSGVVSAQVVENIISIPVDSVLRAPAGSVTLVASAPVPGEFQGARCVAEVEVDNQESVHDQNDLIVASGATSGVVANFESEAFGVRTVEIPLTLGTTVDISLRMGPDEVSSGGVFITVDCTPTTPPTTTPPTTTPPTTGPSTTTTTTPPTTGPSTTTTTTPPIVAPPTTGPSTTTTTVVATLPPGGGAPNPPAAVQPPPSGLPATGPSGTTWAAIAAIALIGAGLGLTGLSRQKR